MNLRIAEGWRRLGVVSLMLGAPVALALLIYALFDIQSFMHSPVAFWILLGCVMVPYAIAYVADMLRRRESRRGTSPGEGDGSVLKIERTEDEPVEGVSSPTAPKSSPASAWVWVGLGLVAAYVAFRFWILLRDGVADWTLVVAVFLLAAAAVLAPSYLAWSRFQRTVSGIPAARGAWPVLRSDAFATELHRFRPAADVPQDLCLAFSDSHVSVWTCDRSPRPLLVPPLDGQTAISATTIQDRLGSQAIRIHRSGMQPDGTFDLIVRPKGPLTYFRAPEGTASRLAQAITHHGERSKPS